MAEKDDAATPMNDGWQEGTLQIGPREARRAGSSTVAHSSGLQEFNVSATADSDKAARARGIVPEEGYLFKYLTKPSTGELALIAVKQPGPGTIGVNRRGKGASVRITCHVGPAYLECPELRPITKSRCIVSVVKNPKDGLPMLTIALKAGTAMQTQSRTDSDK